jgi:branched-chain amino acid transport system permease protein
MTTLEKLPPLQETPAPDFLKRHRPAILAIAFIAIAFALLLLMDRSNLLFPLWSSIAFPMLAVAPFIVLASKVSNKLKAFLILVVLLLIVPYLGIKDSFYLELVVQIGIFAALALGLNIVVGFAGLLDLGYIAFFAVGAYAWGIFASTQSDNVVMKANSLASPDAFYVFLFIGVGFAALAGILLGLPVLRLKGDYLAIVTLGFGEMIRVLVSNLSNISSDPLVKVNITNGAQGLPGILRPTLPPFVFDQLRALTDTMRSLGLLKVLLTDSQIQSLAYQFFFYFLVIIIGAFIVVLAGRLDNSPIGRAWTAIREDEIAARAMGVPLVRMKLLAFAMGASFAGAMGVIYAAKQTFVSPESFSFNQSIFILVIVIVGGMGSIRGVILGAVTVTLLNLQILPNLSLILNSLKSSNDVAPWIRDIVKAWPSQLEPAKYQRFVFGILLVLMMIFRPAGILPASRRKMEILTRMGKVKNDAEKPKNEPPPDLELSHSLNVPENLVGPADPEARQNLSES